MYYDFKHMVFVLVPETVRLLTEIGLRNFTVINRDNIEIIKEHVHENSQIKGRMFLL
jgi:hypothetical protein